LLNARERVTSFDFTGLFKLFPRFVFVVTLRRS